MTYKTINVVPETYEKLLLYKHGNMTFDDVINGMIELLPEEEFYMRVLEEHRKRMEEARRGEVKTHTDLRKALSSI